MMRIVEFIGCSRGPRGSDADVRRACDTLSVPLRETLLEANELLCSGSGRVLVRDQPRTFAHKDQQQGCGDQLRPPEALR